MSHGHIRRFELFSIESIDETVHLLSQQKSRWRARKALIILRDRFIHIYIDIMNVSQTDRDASHFYLSHRTRPFLLLHLDFFYSRDGRFSLASVQICLYDREVIIVKTRL